MIIVSACLCGINTRYDGRNNLNEKVAKLLMEGRALLICPEQLGGLSTPRLPHEIMGGTGAEVLDGCAKVISAAGEDSTRQFIKGAEESLRIAQQAGAKAAVLKAKSPSCGSGKIYDGSFTKTLTEGNGVTAEIFIRNGIQVYNEDNIELLIE